MRMDGHCRSFRAGALALALCGAGAAAARGEPLTLDEARRLAAERGYVVASARSDVAQARGLQLQSRAFANPVVSASVQKLNLTSPGAGGSTSDAIVAAQQLFEFGGKRASRTRAADAGLAAAEGRLDRARAAADAAVVKAYVAAVAAERTAEVTRESAASLSRAADIAEARFRAGEISAAEREQTRVAAGRFAADARTAESAALQARIALQLQLGDEAPDGGVALADDLAGLGRLVAAKDALPGASADAGAAVDARGDVRAALAAADQAAAVADLQRAQRVPDPALFAQYESDRPDNPHTLGFGVAFSLPVWNRGSGAVEAADAAAAQARRDAERARAVARAELASARGALAAALERRRVLRDDLLPRAESVRDTVSFAYERGHASLLERLEAERSLNDVRIAAVGAESDALSAAADLAAALGETLP